jgi:hypothetical protein
MCIYYMVNMSCGHATLMAGPYCHLLLDQLNRINDPNVPRDSTPFEIPMQCLPNPRNISSRTRRLGNRYCSMECQNNGLFGPKCGASGARFGPGTQKAGVGWRGDASSCLRH